MPVMLSKATSVLVSGASSSPTHCSRDLPSTEVHCSQQKGRFLLFLLSSHNHSNLTEGISYRFWKSDEH